MVVAIGGNLAGQFADLPALFEAALLELPKAGLHILSRSSWWRSAAWPDPRQPDYLNGVVLVETALSPRETLEALLRIERAFGRRRDAPNAPRTLDLDLIAHGRTVGDEPGLTVPHPRAHERRFVMGPLAEIAPEWTHPVLGATAAALAANATVGRDAVIDFIPPPLSSRT
ncbi:MAG: 2-amino-4-hydroxy-6-hydroxymethyldihydropteridine diphosphokinase [Caulobacterales bacterium]